MDYKFNRKLDGTIDFIYKKDGEEKTINFQKNVKIATILAETEPQAEINLILDLSKKGMTIEDLKIKKVKNAKTIIDESNYLKLKENYVKKEQQNVMFKVIEEAFGMSLTELLTELGIDMTSDSEKLESFFEDFIVELMGVDRSKIPSKEKKQ